jgi:hypothetical protein
LLVGAVRPQVRVARRCAILRRHDGIPQLNAPGGSGLLGFDGLSRSRIAAGSTEPSPRSGFSSAEKRKMHVKCGRRACDGAQCGSASKQGQSLQGHFQARRDPFEKTGIFR